MRYEPWEMRCAKWKWNVLNENEICEMRNQMYEMTTWETKEWDVRNKNMSEKWKMRCAKWKMTCAIK